MTMKAWALLLFTLTIGNVARSEDSQKPQVSPNRVEFGVKNVGTSGEQALTLANPGAASLEITSILTSGIDFSQTNDCGSRLASGSQCAIRLTFKPATIGPRIGQLSVITSVTIQSIPLSGTGQ